MEVNLHSVAKETSPLGMLQIEKWLEKVLGASLTAEEKERSEFLSATEFLGIDRSTLSKMRIDRRCQDRIYRTLFVYSTGVHQVIRECSFAETEGVVAHKLWSTFVRVLEHCDPVHSHLICSAHQTEQGRFLTGVIDSQRSAMLKISQTCALFRDQVATSQQEIMALQERIQRDEEEEKRARQVILKSSEELRAAFTSEREQRLELAVQLEEALLNLSNTKSNLADKKAQIQELNETNAVLRSDLERFQESSSSHSNAADKLRAIVERLETEQQTMRTRIEKDAERRVELVEYSHKLSTTLHDCEIDRDRFASMHSLATAYLADYTRCLQRSLPVIPSLLQYIDEMENWKQLILRTLASEVPQFVPAFKSLRHSFSSNSEVSDYYGCAVESAASNPALDDIGRHCEELQQVVQDLIAFNQPLKLPPVYQIQHNLHCSADLDSLTEFNSKVQVRLASAESALQVWREVALKATASDQVHSALLDQYKNKCEVQSHRLADLSKQHSTLDGLHKQLVSAYSTTKSALAVAREEALILQSNLAEAADREKAHAVVESMSASLHRDNVMLKDSLAKKEKAIRELQEHLEESRDTTNSLSRVMMSMMMLFPMLQQELSFVINCIQDTVTTCERNGFELKIRPHDAVDTTSLQALRMNMEELSLMSSDNDAVLSVVDSLIELKKNAGIFGLLSEQTSVLAASVTSLNADIDHYKVFIERERIRMCDMLSKGEFPDAAGRQQQGGARPGTAESGESLLESHDKKEKEGAALREAKQLLKLEQQQRTADKMLYQLEVDQLKHVISSRVQSDKAKAEALVERDMQTDPEVCEMCVGLRGQVEDLASQVAALSICQQCLQHEYTESQLQLDVVNLKEELSKSVARLGEVTDELEALKTSSGTSTPNQSSKKAKHSMIKGTPEDKEKHRKTEHKWRSTLLDGDKFRIKHSRVSVLRAHAEHTREREDEEDDDDEEDDSLTHSDDPLAAFVLSPEQLAQGRLARLSKVPAARKTLVTPPRGMIKPDSPLSSDGEPSVRSPASAVHRSTFVKSDKPPQQTYLHNQGHHLDQSELIKEVNSAQKVPVSSSGVESQQDNLGRQQQQFQERKSSEGYGERTLADWSSGSKVSGFSLVRPVSASSSYPTTPDIARISAPPSPVPQVMSRPSSDEKLSQEIATSNVMSTSTLNTSTSTSVSVSVSPGKSKPVPRSSIFSGKKVEGMSREGNRLLSTWHSKREQFLATRNQLVSTAPELTTTASSGSSSQDRMDLGDEQSSRAGTSPPKNPLTPTAPTTSRATSSVGSTRRVSVRFTDESPSPAP